MVTIWEVTAVGLTCANIPMNTILTKVFELLYESSNESMPKEFKLLFAGQVIFDVVLVLVNLYSIIIAIMYWRKQQQPATTEPKNTQ